MIFRLEITCDNAAFEDDPSLEVSCILQGLAKKFERQSGMGAVLFDTNGNRVGRCWTEGEAD